ncbi:Site-specific recombinase [Flavobacterium glycines]|uniref:Recombinase n=1 Tax=Flavobacterium glycines TaxID=551990 RepID=A0A1B9DTM7_9FLAO|nr:recombinase [Flavobacterium glycines]OCB73048.1 recombinase [Flavobacterium glycines]GEL10193.1 recombinase [Flavobacterium glycines]SDI77605.1 Site-specific recombinase [Flavobacterium glycines]
MRLIKAKIKPTFVQRLTCFFEESSTWREEKNNLEPLIELIQLIRPIKTKGLKEVNLFELIAFLKDNPSNRKELSVYLKEILSNRKFNKIFSDAAILQDVDFIFEVKKRILAKILPYQPQKDTLEYVLNQVFYLATDSVWIAKIPMDQLEELYDLLEFESMYESVETNSALSELLIAMHLITQRISGRAMETDVIKMVPEFDNLESPFSAFEKELFLIEDEIIKSENHFIASGDLSFAHLLVLLKHCEEFVEKAFRNSSKYGISLRVNQNLLKIKQQLDRLKFLISLLKVANEGDKKNNGIMMALQLIQFNCYKNNVRKFIGESIQLISYEITQHTAKTGEKYITESRKEYFKMFWNALGGGFIVGILCVIKVLLAKVDTSIFGSAFLYSMNYAFGFIAIYILGFTLATKQPAMTASALIKALEEGESKQGKKTEKYNAFAILFARVFRSQFIAFVGNVIMAFPLSLLGIWLIDYTLDYNIAAAKWEKLITDLSPVHSLAIFHAAIAGVFLFLSGIISGSVTNRDKHNQVYFRIAEHPLLKKSIGKLRTQKLAALYEKKWAGIISNFWFGVFMGSTASIGIFLGLNLDIRHITFASGNLALGLYGANYDISDVMLFWGIFGIGVIGLVNFMVSFSLSLGLAFRSRAIPLGELRFVTASIWNHFKSKPFSFFFPTERKLKSAVVENYLQAEKDK